MMIAVIADDLTGAAEIGGIGLGYNLKVEIANTVDPNTGADMLVINTDARSKTLAEAVAGVEEVSRALNELHPQLLYKKIDSVMRGHVLAEIEAQCAAMQLNRALIVPANPVMGRTLVDGHYYINGEPVHETSFGQDPEFPVTHSHMLSRFGDGICVQQHTTNMPPNGIVVGEAENAHDLQAWAKHLQTDTLAAGAAGFFTACMDALYEKSNAPAEPVILRSPILYVSGSTFALSASLVNALHINDGPVSYMPEALMLQDSDDTGEAMKSWIRQTIDLLQGHGKAVMAILQTNTGNAKYDARHLRKQMAVAVKGVFENMQVRELVIEGGSSAAAILEELNINSIFPAQELLPGVIRNAATAYNDLYITLKPGSYKWSNEVWVF